MKKLIAMLLALVMLLALCACGQTAAPAEQSTAAPAENPTAEPVEEPTDDVGEPVNLIFSIAAVPTDAHGAAQKVFKETLESISGGNMTVECYDSGTLYGQDTEHDALKNGDVDMIYSSASWLTDGSPWISMFTAGYVFQSYDHMTKVLNGDIGKEVFQKIADEQGILPLGAYYLGTRQVSLSEDRQIKTPEDLNGVNLRMPNSDAWVFLGKAMGANPTAIAFNDLYLALQTGTVDFICTDMPTAMGAVAAYPDMKILDFTDSDDNFEVDEGEINIGISVMKGNTELKEAIDSVLSTMTADDFNTLMNEAIAIQPLSE